jgi:hypothetical protein
MLREVRGVSKIREIGDELFITWNNQYYGQKCKIIKINKKKGYKTYDIELLEKKESWLRAEEGEKVVITFSDVEYGELKESID